MKEIKLTLGKVALVDDDDYDWLNQYKWFAHKDGNTYYAGRSVKRGDKRVQLWMHREIIKAPKGIFTDHIDRDGLNNQKSNLRLASNSQNQQNKRTQGKSKYHGVSFFSCVSPNGRPVRACICYNNNPMYLGSFFTEEDAARAYDKKAKELFGEFATLNFPNE